MAKTTQVKNLKAVTDIWVGQEIAAGATYTLDENESHRWKEDSKVIADVASGDLLVINKNYIKVTKEPYYNEYGSIAAAAASITDSSSTNLYLIQVDPGIYTEPVINVPAYVSITGSTITRTVVVPDGSHHVFVMPSGGGQAEISFLSIEGNSAIGYAGVDASNCGDYSQMHKVSIYDCDIGILINSTTDNSTLFVEYVDLNGTYTTGIKVQSTSPFTSFVNLENFYTFPDTSGTTVDQILIDGAGSSAILLSSDIKGHGGDVGILVTNGGTVGFRGGYVNNCLTGVYADTNGTNPYIALGGVSFLECTTNFNIENTTATGNFTGYSEYLKKSINNSNEFFITGRDANIVTVAKKGGDFTSVKAAMDAISPNSIDRYTISVGPGVFVEDTIAMKPYSMISGSGAQVTIISVDTPTKTVIVGSTSCSIYDCTISDASGVDGKGVFCQNVIGSYGEPFLMSNCIFLYNDTHLVIDGSVGVIGAQINFCRFDPSFTNGIVCTTSGGNLAQLYASNLVVFHSGPTVGDFIYLAGTGVTAFLSSVSCSNTSLTGTGIHLRDGAKVVATSSAMEGFNIGLWVENVGAASIVYGQITFLNNTVSDILIEHPNTLGSITGSATNTKVTVDPSSSIAMSYADPTAGQVVLKSIYQGSRHDRLLNLSTLARATSTLGLHTGGELSISSGRIIDVTAGSGFLMDATDQYIKEISWGAGQVTIPAKEDHYIFIDISGSIVTSQSTQVITEVILLGRAYADTSDIDFIEESNMPMNQYSNSTEYYLRDAVGPIFGTGCITTENITTSRSLDVTGGHYYFGVNRFNTSGGNGVPFECYYKSGTVGVWNNIENQTVVDNLKYDNGSGTLADLTAVAQVVTVTPDVSIQSIQHYIQTINGTPYDFTSDATPTAAEVVTGLTALINADTNCKATASGTVTLILTAKTSGVAFTHSESSNLIAVETTSNSAYYAKHSFYTIGDTTNEKYFFIYSQAQYATLLAAQEASIPTPPAHIKDAVVLIATIIAQKSGEHLIQIDDQRPRLGFKPSTLTGISVHGELQGLSTDDHKQYLLITGARAMTGNIDMGGNNVTNVNLVDGVDVSAHASRHLPNGADPLATAAAISVATANAEGNANSLARSNHTHQGVHSIHSNSDAQRYGDISLVNGTDISIVDDGSGNYTVNSTVNVSTQVATTCFEDFVLSGDNTLHSEFSFVPVVSTGGVVTFPDTITGNNFLGVVTLATGTTNNGTGRAALTGWGTVGKLVLGGMQTIFEMRVRIPTLSGTPAFQALYGLESAVAAGLPVNGIYFYYTNTVNAGQWVCTCRSASSSTDRNSTIAVTANQWYKLKFVVNSTGTSVTFYIDDVQIGLPVTANITTTALFPFSQIQKTSSSTTSRTTNVDYFLWKSFR